MGVFDYVRCLCPLPEGAPTDGYQTKDTPAQYLDRYEIRADGSLWHEQVERQWVEDRTALLGGHMDRVSQEWVHQGDFTGEVRFYNDEWEFSAYFVRGLLEHLEAIETPDRAGPREGGSS
jgi:hypothetical protein